MIPLLGATIEQLGKKARDLRDFITYKNPASLDIIALAYTLQTGRDAMEERLVLWPVRWSSKRKNWMHIWRKPVRPRQANQNSPLKIPIRGRLKTTKKG